MTLRHSRSLAGATLLATFALTGCASTAHTQRPAPLPRGTLVVSNMSDNTVTILDAATTRVLATLPTGEGPHEVAVSHDGATALVSNYGVRGKPGSTLTVIDVPSASIARTLTIEKYTRPHGMSFLPGDSLVAITSETGQAVIVVDVRNGRVVRAIPTRARGSHMVALTADGRRAFTANIPDGTVSGLDVTTGESETRLFPVGSNPEGIAVSPDGKLIWVGSNRDSTVHVVDAITGISIDTLRGFGMPYRLAVTPDGRTVVASDPVKGEVRVFDAVSRKALATIPVPNDSLVSTAEVAGSSSPEGVATSRDSRWAFVTVQGRNRVVWIDLARRAIVAWAPTGTWSDGIGYSPVVARPRTSSPDAR